MEGGATRQSLPSNSSSAAAPGEAPWRSRQLNNVIKYPIFEVAVDDKHALRSLAFR